MNCTINQSIYALLITLTEAYSLDSRELWYQWEDPMNIMFCWQGWSPLVISITNQCVYLLERPLSINPAYFRCNDQVRSFAIQFTDFCNCICNLYSAS